MNASQQPFLDDLSPEESARPSPVKSNRGYQPVQNERHKAEKLKRSAGWTLSILLELLLLVVILCFLALAGLAVWLRGQPTGSTIGQRVEEAMKLGPTIYPVIFAALLSRSLKNIGRHRAQRGTRLLPLWTLMNTNTVSDPVSHILKFPTSPLVWCLLALWAMSPLGGQGSLRLMSPANSTAITSQKLRYWDSGPLGNMHAYQWIWVQYDGAWPLSMRDIYLSGLMQNGETKTGPRDQWGNVKIPRLPNGYSSSPDSGDWVSVATDGSMQPEDYTSLFGIPIVGLGRLNATKMQFSIETVYVELSCSEARTANLTGESAQLFLNSSAPDVLDQGQVSEARISSFLGPPLPVLTAAQRSNVSYTQPQKIRITSLDTSFVASQVDCPVTQRMVESFIECSEGNCAVTKMRPSKTDHRSPNITSFDYWASVVLEMIAESTRLTGGDPGQVTIGISSSQLFLNDSRSLPLQDSRLFSGQGNVGVMPFSSIPIDVLSARASVLLNTGLQVFMCPTGFAGDLVSNDTAYGPDHIPIDGLSLIPNLESDPGGAFISSLPFGPMPFVGASTNATVVRTREVYRPNYVWVVLLLVSAVLLLSVAGIGIALQLGTIAPDMFDPVMGLTYNNRDMPAAAWQASLDAEGRARALADERVRLGYVDEGAAAARVTFGEEASVSQLKKGRWYY